MASCRTSSRGVNIGSDGDEIEGKLTVGGEGRSFGKDPGAGWGGAVKVGFRRGERIKDGVGEIV